MRAESVRHLQTIQDICEVAANFQQDEAAFLDRMDYLKPRFDTALLAFLTHSIAEEENKMTSTASTTQSAMHSDWLQILKIVKQGVMAEFETRYDLLLEPLMLAVRFYLQAVEDVGNMPLAKELLRRFVEVTPTIDLPFLKELASNMIENVLANQLTQQVITKEIRRNLTFLMSFNFSSFNVFIINMIYSNCLM